jgi:hypothetical protein
MFYHSSLCKHIGGCIQKFLDDNEIYTYNNKHSLRSNTKGYGGKTHYTSSQNSGKTALSGRELFHLQFSLQVASPESFGYTLVLLLMEYVANTMLQWKVLSFDDRH